MPTIESHNFRKPVHSKCFGIEIECLVRQSFLDEHEHYTHGKFFYFSRDVSISPDSTSQRGMEIVSQPLPYSWLIKQIKKLSKDGRWEFNNTCGIHVHVSRSSVSFNRLRDLANFFTGLGGRQIAELFGRLPNDYCWNRGFCPHNRYSLINFTNRNTIEFRMFRSGDAAWAIECVRRTKLMCEYKGKLSFENLKKLFGI